MKQAIILLSAGLDSTVNAAIAIEKGYRLFAVTFDYGQKAAGKEIEHAAKIRRHYGIDGKVIELPWLSGISDSALLNKKNDIVDFDKSKLSDVKYSSNTARNVWVPNRNGVFINIVASIAEAYNYQEIIVGFNREEASTFPDNSSEFIKAINKSLCYSTRNNVVVKSFTVDNNKKEIADTAKRLNVPLNLCWPCYRGEEDLCGKCESCVRFLRAVE